MIVTAAALALGLALQFCVLSSLRPMHLIGDEHEYGRADPPAMPWVRVPLNRFVMRAAIRVSGRPDHMAARAVNGVFAAIGVGLAVGWTEYQAGPFSALAVAGILLISVERALLAMHLWPDTALGVLWLAAAILFDQDRADLAPMMAVIGGLALGLRVDGLAISALAIVAGVLAGGGGIAQALPACLITAGFIAVYTAWNRARSGHWILDSTIGFNLSVFRNDATGRFDSIGQVMRHVRVARSSGQVAQARLRTPAALLPRILARLRLLLGPETFLSEVVMRENAGGYRQGHALLRNPALRGVLRWHFPILMALTLFTLPGQPGARAVMIALPILVFSLLVTRSRYRMALLPMMAVFAAEGVQMMLFAPTGRALVIGTLLMALFAALLRAAPRLRER